jgi:hypothetical protein
VFFWIELQWTPPVIALLKLPDLPLIARAKRMFRLPRPARFEKSASFPSGNRFENPQAGDILTLNHFEEADCLGKSLPGK